MTPSRSSGLNAAAIVTTLACLGFAVWLGLYGPEGQIPMHLNAAGEVDRWGDRREAAWIVGGTTIGLLLAYALTEHSQRKAPESARRGLVFAQGTLIGAMVFVATLMAALAYGGFERGAGPERLHQLVGGLLAFVMILGGAVLGKVAPNPWVGVRTYWALTSRTAWDKSNRLAGRLWFWAGLIGFPAAVLFPGPMTTAAIGAAMLVSALAAVVESWRVWNADPDRRAA